jgi:hypothetical protein
MRGLKFFKNVVLGQYVPVGGIIEVEGRGSHLRSAKVM